MADDGTTADPVAARLGYLRACIEAAIKQPEAFNLPVMLREWGKALDALDAVLVMADHREQAGLSLPELGVPQWIPEVRAAIGSALLGRDGTDEH